MNPPALFEQAAQAFQAGHWAIAEERMQHLLRVKSDNGHHHYILGEIQRLQGKEEAAEASYRQALHLTPDHADAHFHLASLLRARGQSEQAIRHYEAALLHAPHHQEAYLQLGNLLLEGWRQADAIQIYERLLVLQPDHADARHNLGLALVRAARYAEAIPHLERALALRPGWLTAGHILGLAMSELGQVTQAQRAFAPLLASPRGNFALQLHVDTLGVPIADSQDAIDSYLARLHGVLDRKLAAVAEKPTLVCSLSTTQLYDANVGPPFFLSYYGRDLKPILTKWADIFQPRFASEQERPPLPQSARGRPHIGFVVSPGHEEVFLTDRMGLINGLDGQRFQLSIFCAAAAQPLFKARLTNAAVTVHPCTPELDPMAATLRRAACHLLCYWECGSDTLNYFLPFYRLAPIQCLDWGTPYTCGVPTMDYYLSSALLEPTNGDTHYRERLVRLPTIHALLQRPAVPEQLLDRSHFGLRKRDHIYLCAQNPLKLHPDFDQIVGDILRNDPQGTVVLLRKKAHHVAMAQQRMARTLPDVIDRIRWLAAPDERAYFSLLALADVNLDTPHYSSMNISYDTFAVGTPIVTWPGALMRGRYTAALCQQMALDACVADELRQVGLLARQLGCDPAYRREISRRIHENSPILFENRAVVAAFSHFFEEVCARAG